MAKGISNAHLYLTETGDVMPPAPVAITSITNTALAVVTLAAALPPDAANGDIVDISGTGQVLLDGNAFRVANLNTTVPAAPTFELQGFDGTRLTAAVAAGDATLFQKAGDLALLEVCMVTITVAGTPPDSVQLDDMCSTQTVLGSAKPPTFTFTGFVDPESAGFKNLMQASLESPKTLRYVLVDYLANVGYIFGPAEIGEVTITAQTAQGLQFSGSGVFTTMPTYSWAL